MPTTDLTYSVSDGFIHHWLAAGPRITPLPAAPAAEGDEASGLSLIEPFFDPDSGVTQSPVDLGPLDAGQPPADTWRYYRCREDHFVDFTGYYAAAGYLRGWAFARLRASEAHSVTAVLTTNGPADLWLNGQHQHRHAHLAQPGPRSVAFDLALAPGDNDLLIRFENLVVRSTTTVMALRLLGLPEAAQLVLPTNIEPELLAQRLELERLIESATLDRYVYGWLTGDRFDKNEPITVRFPSELDASGQVTFRAQGLAGQIYQERTQGCKAGTTVPIARSFPLFNGPHHLAMLPPAHEYYRKLLRFERRELFHVVRTAYSQPRQAEAAERAQAALEDAAKRRSGSLYCEIAKMALDQWEKVDAKVLQHAVEGIRARRDDSAADLLGLLSSRQRYKTRKHYFEPIRRDFEDAVAGYRYWNDLPAEGGAPDSMDLAAESRQILYHACEVLAGQRLPDRVFACTGQNGRWHRERGERLALAWMRQRGLYGFREWDSPASVETVVAALTCLADLAENAAVAEMASVLLDKVFFSLAVNAFQGAYGSSRGRTDTNSVLSARLEPTSGLAWILWGQGNLNESVMGTVSLAACQKYALPDLIAQIARDPVGAVWNQERHTVPAAEGGEPAWEVARVTYRTKDFMLACAQDYAPGQPGRREHIWQATLGPDAIVYTNHPTSLSVDEAQQPNAWAGNGVLPRAVQWGDVVIALYRLADDDWLGFTHAYFPAAAFDEHAFAGGWAFARKGEGYLALRAGQGQAFITTGPTAYRELRAVGHETVWLCHMGQALLDGSFEAFQQKVQALEVVFDGLSVRLRSLRGEQLAFGWTGPLLVNDQPQPLAGPLHIDNPYCQAPFPASTLDIVHGGEGLRLTFE